MKWESVGKILFNVLLGAIYLFLLAPAVVIMVYSLYPNAYITFPPEGLTLKWYAQVVQADRLFIRPLLASLRLALTAVTISILIGVPAAFAMVRYQFRGKGPLNAFLMSPLLLPPLLVGFTLMLMFNNTPFRGSFWLLVAGHVVITVAYVLRSVSASVAGLDGSVEEAGLSLGSPPWRVFLRVTLPLIFPGLLGGAIFAFVVSFDELPLSLLLSTPRSVTLPVQIYSYVQQNSDPMVAAAATILLAISFVILLVLQRLGGLDDMGY